MKTSSLRTYKGDGRIVISRSCRGVAAGYKTYRALAPGAWFMSVNYEQYRKLFFEQLSKLNAQKVWDDLVKLANGHEPILLCYEIPPFTDTNWCHRRMVAEWFKQELGHEVEELVIDNKKPNPSSQLF